MTEGTARVIAGLCDGDLQPIFEVIEDEAADVFVRCQMIDALVMIARSRPLTKPAITEYLEGFFSADIGKPEELWGYWAFAVADLGLSQLEPQVRQAFEQEWVSPEEASFEFFQDQLRGAIEAGASSWFHRSRGTRPIENAIDELSGWYCFSEKSLKARSAPRRREHAVALLRRHLQTRGAEGGAQRPLPVRQCQEIQEVLRAVSWPEPWRS